MAHRTFRDNRELAIEAGKKSKRGKSEKTILWAALGEMIVNEGAKKAINYLNSLQGETFLKAYISFLEYFKPKLSRVEAPREEELKDNPFEGMTFEQLYLLKYGKMPDETYSDTIKKES